MCRCLVRPGPPEGSLRCFSAFEPHNETFADNIIRTAKYTPLTFLPLNLWEQFHRISNVYFLLISILQFIPTISSVSPTAWLPLLFVLIVNMIKEGIEDGRRTSQDKEINHQTVIHIDPTDQQMKPLLWKDIRVGSVLVLMEDDPIPADVILLATADKMTGLAYIDTVQLDGETNMKSKESVEATHRALTAYLPVGAQQKLVDIPSDHVTLLQSVRVECEQPNAHLEAFTGKVTCLEDAVEAVHNKQVVYRGCTLRNTKWLYALVVFTGMETKLMKNSVHKKIKRTTLDRASNQYVIGLFGLLGGLCLLASVCSAIWIVNHNKPRMWYIDTLYGWGSAVVLNFFTYLILMSAVIPISLNVSAEVVKVFHARFINWDDDMLYVDPLDPSAPVRAKARTSNLSEDLGRIEYIFSDKTGTLTQNVMEYMKCSVAGVAYGTGTTEIGRAAALREGRVVTPDVRPPELALERGNNFYDPRLSFGRWRTSPDAAAIERFYRLLAVCHTVMAKPREGPEEDEASWAPENVAYQASSPDEEALVVGAKGQGFWFKRRNYRDCFVVIDDKAEERYTLIAVNEFSSTRKRMSIVVQTPDGRTVLMAKGADSVIFERLRPADASVAAAASQHLMDFANEGLRTLVLAERELPPEVLGPWKERYDSAFQATGDRDALLDAAAEAIERDLEFVGATAIEDKLQEGVPQAIRKLRAAGIQIWILTGDKVETAINIAMACNLIHPSMHLAKITLPDPAPGKETDEAARRQSVEEQFHAALEDRRLMADSAAGEERALVIDGYALKHALAQEEAAGAADGLMLQYTNTCTSVVCSRVSPKQKADVVSLVRKKHDKITLAIGDGANDVSMILKAHIGVGISGREGQQAAMSSDYSIAQFRFLQNLVLVHGRWSFQRVSLLICYCFYKNIGFAMMEFWFGNYSAYSGYNVLDDFYQSLWNVFFTGVPIIAVSVFNKDIDYKATILEFPEIYMDVQKGQPFTKLIFGAWCLDSIVSGIVAYFVVLYALEPGAGQSSGLGTGKFLVSFTAYAAISTIVNLRLWFCTKTWNVWVTVAQVGSLICFFIFSAIYQLLKPGALFFIHPDYYLILNDFWVINRCWAAVALATAIGLFFPFLAWAVHYSWQTPTKTIRVGRFEHRALNQQRRISRLPSEEAWAKMLPVLRRQDPSIHAALPVPAPASLSPHNNSLDRELTPHGYDPAPTPQNSVDVSNPLTYHNAVTNKQESFLGYSFSGERGASPEVVVPTVPGASLHRTPSGRGFVMAAGGADAMGRR